MNIKKIAAHTACGLVALTAATYALPRHVNLTRSVVVEATPEAVLALAASNEGYQQFNPYRDLDPDLQVALFRPASGIGSGFHFDGRDGQGSQTVAAVSSEQITFDIDLGPLGQPTQAISAIATDQGTVVTWSMDADMGMNPLFRVMGVFMEGMVGPNFELGLANIADVTA